MDILALVKDFGIPLSLLIAAIVALWKAWRTERKFRQSETDKYKSQLKERESELFELYKNQALQRIKDLVEREKDARRNGE